MPAKRKNATGKLIWLVACDESGMDGSVYYGYGSLWMKWQRRGDFVAKIRELRHKHDYPYDEFKWQKAHLKQYHNFFREVIDYFFYEPALAFHCIIVRKAVVKKSTYHNGSIDLARRKHFTKLLTNKMSACIKAHKNRDVAFRIWVDPIYSSYNKADEAVEIIANNTLYRDTGKRPVESVIEKDSKDVEQIQLCDLLLGAVMAPWQRKANAERKWLLIKHIANHLGWNDLRADTLPIERKFNIWYFKGERFGPREPETRRVKLKHPLPPRL